MGIGFYLGAIKYIPYSIKNYKEMKNNKSRIDSYEEGKRRIQQHILPFFYATVLATLIIPFLVIFALIYGFVAYKSIKVLKNIKMLSCDCGRLLNQSDSFSYNVEKEEERHAIVTMDFVCNRCQKPKHLKCDFTLPTHVTSAGYKDETVYTAEATKKPGVYTIRTETKKVSTGANVTKGTPLSVIRNLFANRECDVKVLEEK